MYGVQLSLFDDEEPWNEGSDNVNSPSHYNKGLVECIDAIQSATDDGFEYYLQGNIIKYLWRYRHKNGVEDLRKAKWYLNKLIEIKEMPLCTDQK